MVLYIDVYMKKTVLHSGKMKKKIVHAFVRLYFDQLSARDCFVFLAYHWFNRLLGNGWLDLDDFLGRPPWNFDSDEMLKKSALWHVRARVRVKVTLRDK